MAKAKEIQVKAFIPTKDTIFQVDEREFCLAEGVIYLVPHFLEKWWALQLRNTGHGRVI